MNASQRKGGWQARAFSPKRLAEPGCDVRQAPTPQKKKIAPAPVSNPMTHASGEYPRFADDLLFGTISHLLRHEHDGQSEAEHVISESVLDCVNALCSFYEQRTPDEVLQFRAGQILRLLEVAGTRGQTVYSLAQATELEPQGVLDAIRILQSGGCSIRADLDYARDLELLFFLDLSRRGAK